MPNATNITYGTYDFQRDGGPVPLPTISKTYQRFDNGNRIGSKFTMSLNGELNRVPSGVQGYKNVDEMQDLLCSGFAEDCQQLTISCDGNILLQQYPRINSITFSPTDDNWAQTTDYSIELEWNGEDYSGFAIESATETWDFQANEQSNYYSWDLDGTGDNNTNLFSLSHAISAKGSPQCTGAVLSAWEVARSFVITQLGYQEDKIQNSGIFNLGTGFSGWNHSRVQRIGELAGTFDVTETWLVTNVGLENNGGNATEDFTATTSFDGNNGISTTVINGSINGLENLDYGSSPGDYNIISNKYDNASGYWDNIRPKLAGRASLIGGTDVNVTPLTYSVSHNPSNGIINYTYSYDNRPCNFIPGALSETITVTDDNPTDVFAEIAILGRAYGPVLQDLSTVTSSKRTVNISAIMGPTTGCGSITNSINSKPSVTGLLCQLFQDISGVNTQIYKSQDNENWNFKTGQYSRTVQWVHVNCSGDPPVTTFC